MNRITGPSIQQQSVIGGAAKAEAKKEIKQEKALDTKDSVDIRGKEGQQEEGSAIKPHKKWLFINLVAADCNLTAYQLNNLDQQEKVGSDENTHVVAYVDVGPNAAPMGFGKKAGATEEGQAPQPDTESWSGCRTLYITKDDKVGQLNSEVIEDHGNHVDMSSPQTVEKFLEDALEKFPADHVALIFNDHGGGYTGAMADDTDGDFMSMPQIRQALLNVKEKTGKSPDIIGFDACLMAGAEVGYELKDLGGIMLASEESEGGPGWTYDSMLGGQTINEAIKRTQEMEKLYKINVGPREFAKIVVDVNREHNGDIPTFSATDLGKMDQLKDASEGLAMAIKNTGDKQAIKDAIGVTENYGGGWAPYRDMRDLHHLSRNIISKTSDEKVKKAAEEAMKAVEAAVFANEVNPSEHPESMGLHIYAPTQGSMGEDYKALQFAKDTHWDEAIESLGVKFDPTKRSPKVWPDGSARKPKE